MISTQPQFRPYRYGVGFRKAKPDAFHRSFSITRRVVREGIEIDYLISIVGLFE